MLMFSYVVSVFDCIHVCKDVSVYVSSEHSAEPTIVGGKPNTKCDIKCMMGRNRAG